MSRVTIARDILTDIADAIRTQYKDDSSINPLDMAEAILGIEGGGSGESSDVEIVEIELVNNSKSVTIPTDKLMTEINRIVAVPTPSTATLGSATVGITLFEYIPNGEVVASSTFYMYGLYNNYGNPTATRVTDASKSPTFQANNGILIDHNAVGSGATFMKGSYYFFIF